MGRTIRWAVFLFIAMGSLVNPGKLLARASFDNLRSTGANRQLRPATGMPNFQFDVHNIGRLALTITNFGTFGSGYVAGTLPNGEELPGAEYPISSGLRYLFAGALWIGAVVGQDTLVSVGADGWFQDRELFPDAGAAGNIIARSSLRSTPDYDPGAVSEQDFICTFTDTFTDPPLTGIDPIDNRSHIPLGVAIQQSSYAWSYTYTEDFVLFDCRITNIWDHPLSELYLGLFIDGDVHHRSNEGSGPRDDICGFRRTVAMPPGYGLDQDTINVAWIADNDGDPSDDGRWTFASPTSVTGVRLIRWPGSDRPFNFNWWLSNTNAAYDFGPRMAGTDDDPPRPFGPQLGTPTGDRNKYYMMRHPEFDYDLLFTALSHEAEGFLPPPRDSIAADFSNGGDVRYLLSLGPIDLPPGDTASFTFAYVAGENFHVGPNDYRDYFDAFSPSLYNDKLDFTDLAANARWADWVYDNPGYDTDGDGDSGRYVWRCPTIDSAVFYPEGNPPPDSLRPQCLKLYYRGDGAPDFRAAAPPLPPTLRVSCDYGRITLRWNGREVENTIDVFARVKDFEGYRVYYSQGGHPGNFVLLASYDREDYLAYQYDDMYLVWRPAGMPVTRDSLKTLYGADFDPTIYNSEERFLVDPQGRWLYFRPYDWNQSNLADPAGIHKVFPDASPTDPADTTEEGYLRSYEYEYVIANLQPALPYQVAVTAVDLGSRKIDKDGMESSPALNAVTAYALPSSEKVERDDLAVIVYPNPYRVEGGYAGGRFENRDRMQAVEDARLIHFANLPHDCTIRIYTLSGDLVKEIEHHLPAGDQTAQHETWDVLNRDGVVITTGVYLWHVQSDQGDQLGKVVIIKQVIRQVSRRVGNN